MAKDNKHDGQRAAGGPAAGDRRSRRRVLAGAAGILGVAAAEVAGSAGPARADTGNPVAQGIDNGYPTHRTGVFTPNNAEVGILADPNSSGKGSLGVYGVGNTSGVLGEGGSGNAAGVTGTGAGNGSGVVGNGSDIGAGVIGNGGSGGGDGVQGFGAAGGNGVYGAGGLVGGNGVVGIGGSTGAG